MCGIVGFVGPGRALDVIVKGLRRLEYRGYDSAGVAVLDPTQPTMSTVKAVGKINELEAKLNKSGLPDADQRFTLGIGHTRWATHGEPNEVNAHPHLSRNGEFAIVHNGIIENYASLRDRLKAAGYHFKSQTDSEVIAHLIEECYNGDLTAAVTTAVAQLKGTYGLAIISSKHPDTLIAVRNGSPIVIGVCDDATIVSSDVSAIVRHTDRVVFLNDGDILTATAGTIDVTSSDRSHVTREPTRIDWDIGKIEKSGYEHFMLKEIHEQPNALADAMRGRLIDADGTSKLSGLQMDSYEMARVEHLIIAACGTSLYAGMVGKYLFEDIAQIPCDAQQAAEFRYRNPMIQRDTYMLAISQSGETADTLAAVREGKRKGAVVLGVCNVVGSTIAREAGRGIYIHAGPEIGVASTKAFSCQVAVLSLAALGFGRTRRLSLAAGRDIAAELKRLPDIANQVLQAEDHIKAVAEKYAKAEHFFYIGRGYMYPAALEGALKLKEISYIHAEGYHAAELKHGPIALLDKSVPVMVAAPDVPEKAKIIGNMQECRARKSPVIAIATEGDDEITPYADDIIRIPRCAEFVSPIPVVIAEQLFAYHVARARGCAIDQPRNLAKSVTVE